MADGFGRHASPGRHAHRAATQSRPAPYEPAPYEPAPYEPARGRPGRGRPGLRRVSAAALVMLVLQYGLGMILSFYVEVPAADAHAGVITEIRTAPLALTAHALLGVALAGTAILTVARAVALRDRLLAVLATAGLAAIVGAFVAGEMFVKNGEDSTSFAMAMLTGAALLSYLALLVTVGRTSPGADRQTGPLLASVPAARSPEDTGEYPDDDWGAEPGWDDDADWAGRLRQDAEAGWPGYPGWDEQPARAPRPPVRPPGQYRAPGTQPSGPPDWWERP
jgi:hypothetical protein